MENKKEFTEKEVYEIAVDAYKQTHKLSYLLLHRALKSVLKKITRRMCYLSFDARNEHGRTQNKDMNCIDNFLGTFKTEHILQ